MTKFPGHRSPGGEFRAILAAPKTQFSPKAQKAEKRRRSQSLGGFAPLAPARERREENIYVRLVADIFRVRARKKVGCAKSRVNMVWNNVARGCAKNFRRGKSASSRKLATRYLGPIRRTEHPRTVSLSELPPLLAEIHRGLPRQGPGDSASTTRAFAMLEMKTPAPRILDVGCGPGAQTIDLAQLSNGVITALDSGQIFLDELENRIKGSEAQARIRPVRGSMFDMPFGDGAFDLIWSEGAIYIIGFEKGLKTWRRFLADGGAIAVSHISWLRDNIPEAPRTFWKAAYPAITTVEDNLAILRASGFEPAGHFVLPQAAWWSGYYDPMEARLTSLHGKYAGDAAALAVIAESQREIDLYRSYSGCYGYVFYTARKA
jgi:ubiquinone/menaquinone biosynthesis C-methylase UbiE